MAHVLVDVAIQNFLQHTQRKFVFPKAKIYFYM